MEPEGSQEPSSNPTRASTHASEQCVGIGKAFMRALICQDPKVAPARALNISFLTLQPDAEVSENMV
jgi:hypothetical protein